VCHLEEIRNTEEKIECKLHPLENHTESDDMSIECFPGIEDLELDSDFTIRTIPLEFEVKRRHSIQHLRTAYYLLRVVSD